MKNSASRASRNAPVNADGAQKPSARAMLVLAGLMLFSSASILYLTAHYHAKERILFARGSQKAPVSKVYPNAITFRITGDTQTPVSPRQVFTLSIDGVSMLQNNTALKIQWLVPSEIQILGEANGPKITLQNADDEVNRQIHAEVFQIRGEGKQGSTAQFETRPDTAFNQMSRALIKKSLEKNFRENVELHSQSANEANPSPVQSPKRPMLEY